MLLAGDGVATRPDEEIAAVCLHGIEGAGDDTDAQWIAGALFSCVEDHGAPRQDNATIVVVLPDHEREETSDEGDANGATTTTVSCKSAYADQELVPLRIRRRSILWLPIPRR